MDNKIIKVIHLITRNIKFITNSKKCFINRFLLFEGQVRSITTRVGKLWIISWSPSLIILYKNLYARNLYPINRTMPQFGHWQWILWVTYMMSIACLCLKFNSLHFYQVAYRIMKWAILWRKFGYMNEFWMYDKWYLTYNFILNSSC